METPLYFTVQAGFVLLTVVYIGLLIWEFRKGLHLTGWDPARKKRFFARLICAVVIWTLFLSAWSVSGRMSNFSQFPLNFLPVVVVPLISVVALLSSKAVGEVLQNIPPDNLIRLQSFRVFVEIMLWMLFIVNLVPVQMTFEGRNYDILAGLTAPIVAFLIMKRGISKTSVIIWNLICLGLLLNIVITAILSTPSPWRVFMNEPANDIVTYFPISWLPGVLVPLAYYLHLFSLKQVILQRRGIKVEQGQPVGEL